MSDSELMEVLRRDSHDENSDVRQRVARILMERTDPESLDLLVELAGDPDWRVRKVAIEGLEANPTEGVVSALVPALFDPANAGRRNAAVEALRAVGLRALPYLLAEGRRATEADQKIALATVFADIDSPDSTRALLDMVRDKDVNVAATAIVALGQRGSLEAVPALVEVLSGDNAWLHYHAIEALGHLRAIEALPAIVACDRNPALKKAILEAAGAIGGYAAIDFLASRLASSPMPDFPLLLAFNALDESPRPSLLAQRERAYMRRKFRENCPPGTAGALVLALKKTERPDRKVDLLRALGWTAMPEALPPLISYLSTDFSESAEKALADFGPAAQPALLAEMSPAADEQKLEMILRLLLRYPDPQQVFPVLSLLEHESPIVRRSAVDVLGKLGDPRAGNYLIAHLSDGDAGVDVAAVEALTALARQHPEISGELSRAALRGTGSPDSLTRANALSLMAGLDSEEFHSRILAASKDKDAIVRARAVQLAAASRDLSLLPIFEHGLADEIAHVRQAAVAAFGSAGLRSHSAAVAACLEDDDVWVRAAACRTLGVLESDEHRSSLARLAASGEPPERIAALEGLGRIGGASSWEPLALALTDSDAEIRQAALFAAADLHLPEADSEIDRLAGDPDWRLRATALEAMGRRGRRERADVLQRALLEEHDDLVARSALTAIESMVRAEDIPVLVRALGREGISEDVCGALVRLRPRFEPQLQTQWREADPRRAGILAEILRSGPEP